uniref:Uncharacterized protein n=1 Tax=Rhizophagus irregularis (strain DAOM 181602 / DAOM 197198 / MUCL 43194) TaxID=747089 RepID=U9URX5_RHIID
MNVIFEVYKTYNLQVPLYCLQVLVTPSVKSSDKAALMVSRGPKIQIIYQKCAIKKQLFVISNNLIFTS